MRAWSAVVVGGVFLMALLAWGYAAGRSRPAGGSVGGVVRDSRGRPIPDASVTIRDTTATEPIADIAPITDDEGRFGWGSLPPGHYRLQASAVGYKPGEQLVEVKPGAAATADFELERP